ncbi:hypothetical protein [Microbacterium aurantiacum]|uniref:hypothetical protein n=1 Tax=Microbacterium aurantiacum TaxID=162393 RepID=UPI000C806442|nr:hypothetical protein [Microbacterium aurantiacum]
MTIPEPPLPAVTTEAPPKAPSWWRRNRVALVAVAILLPATVVAIGGQNWRLIYAFDARPVDPVVVGEKDSAELAGATFGPVRSGVIDDLSGLDVPEGAKVIAAAIPVDSGAEGVSCRRPTLTHQASGRQWTLMRSEIGVEYNAEEPEFCSSEETGSYEIIAPFVVPEDLEGPFWVDVWPQGVGGTFLRFPIDP